MEIGPRGSAAWRKSSYSSNNTACVEVAVGSAVGVRDTKNRASGQLTLTSGEWTAFLDAVKHGKLA